MKQFSLEEYLKNPNRKVITRDGHDVRIVCTDCKNYEYPTVALVTCDDNEFVVNCTKEGKCHTPNKYKYDLFFASKKNINKANIFFQSRIVKLLSILIMAENIAEKNMETVLSFLAE